MKTLTVPCIPAGEPLEQFLYDSASSFIDQQPWPSGFSVPQAVFSIAHRTTSIFVLFQISEKEIRAVNTGINTPVYEDSCVEFFLQLPGEDGYYNFEFNCTGTVLAGYGPGRTRELLPEKIVSQIKRTVKITRGAERTDISWELIAEIPLTVFCKHNLSTFAGLTCKANFYKCGDELTEPHYLAWNNIQTEEPDFHLPEYFGQLTFNQI
ncbi:carbohydrate-binding family 9-like protein [Pedobacter antarcticus]|uniref:carbohydrate-binding family 9-like protein n=1 Tax=Pedobacter antarcticus TaxID=34086 RepID=UPI00292EFB38|nr:carbohydrate-binding family 9-like protein [Pedobacter antarcticus]